MAKRRRRPRWARVVRQMGKDVTYALETWPTPKWLARSLAGLVALVAARVSGWQEVIVSLLG